MDLRDYLATLGKYWVSVLATTVLGGLVAGVVTLLITPVFTAHTTILLSVQGGNNAGELAAGATYAATQARTYAMVVATPVVLQPVIDELGLDVTPGELGGRITASTPSNTAVIGISVVDSHPERAAQIANLVSQQVVSGVESLSPLGPSGSRVVTAIVVTPATVPQAQSSPQVSTNLALGLLVGLLLGLSQATLRKALDQRIRTEADVARAGDVTVVARIPLGAGGSAGLVMLEDPHSARAEAFRGLRTNVQFLDIDEALGTCFVVTSALPGEGKTTTVLNLAVALADNGESVLVIDADLRRPQVAAMLGMEEAAGLTTVLIGRADLREALQPVGKGNLQVLTSGLTPPNPAELVASEAMRRLVRQARSDYDVVLIDAPPLLPVTDAAILASIASGALLVTSTGSTTVPQLAEALTVLQRASARGLGVVLNKAPATASTRQDTYYREDAGSGTQSRPELS